jgi:dolichol kinase
MNAGVLALSVGDAMGAVVGSSIGKHKFFGSKTAEGSAAVFISMLLASVPLHDYYMRAFISGEYIQVELLSPHEVGLLATDGAVIVLLLQLALFLVAAFLMSVLEAATAQIDNLVLPLFVYTTCNRVSCHGL